MKTTKDLRAEHIGAIAKIRNQFLAVLVLWTLVMIPAGFILRSLWTYGLFFIGALALSFLNINRLVRIGRRFLAEHNKVN